MTIQEETSRTTTQTFMCATAAQKATGGNKMEEIDYGHQMNPWARPRYNKEDDRREYLEYKREIMEIDEKSAAEEAATREEVLRTIEENPGAVRDTSMTSNSVCCRNWSATT